MVSPEGEASPGEIVHLIAYLEVDHRTPTNQKRGDPESQLSFQ
jgi:hypothetical protein